MTLEHVAYKRHKTNKQINMPTNKSLQKYIYESLSLQHMYTHCVQRVLQIHIKSQLIQPRVNKPAATQGSAHNGWRWSAPNHHSGQVNGSDRKIDTSIKVQGSSLSSPSVLHNSAYKWSLIIITCEV